MNPYIAVGVGQGLENARRRMRDETLENEDRAERKSELEYQRGRRKVVDEREDVSYADDREDRPLKRKALETQVEGAETQVEGAKVNVARAKQSSEWEIEDRPLQVEGQKLGLEAARADFEDAKTTRSRESELHDIKIKKIRQSMQDEGLDRFLDTIEGGADPEYAVTQFNAQGKNGIRPGTVHYDKGTGAISFMGKDGHQFNGTVQQLRSALPEQATTKPINVAAGGSLYDPKTKTWMQPPGAAGKPGGQKLSPFNPQTHGKQTRDLVIQGLGGEWDNSLQKFKVPAGMGEKVSYGTSLADQVIKLTEEEGMRLGPGEVSNVVNTVMRDVRTTGDAIKMARSELGNVDDASIQTRAQEIVDDSKTRAAIALKTELAILRSNYQQQEAAQQFPTDPGTSPDMGGGEPGGADNTEAPPMEMLREGYVQRFKDGSSWTLQGGKPVRVE